MVVEDNYGAVGVGLFPLDTPQRFNTLDFWYLAFYHNYLIINRLSIKYL
jgi:hypothetical protein